MALTEQEEFELLSLEREKAMGSGQNVQTPQTEQPQQNILDKKDLLGALLLGGGGAVGYGAYRGGVVPKAHQVYQQDVQKQEITNVLKGLQKQLGIEGTEAEYIPKKISEIETGYKSNIKLQERDIKYKSDLALKNAKSALDDFDNKIVSTNVDDLSKTLEEKYPQFLRSASEGYRTGMDAIESHLEAKGLKFDTLKFQQGFIDKSITEGMSRGLTETELAPLIRLRNEISPKFNTQGILESEKGMSFSQMKGYISGITRQEPQGKLSALVNKNWIDFLDQSLPDDASIVKGQLSKINAGYKQFAEARFKYSKIISPAGEFDRKAANKYLYDYFKSNIDDGTKQLMGFVSKGNDIVNGIEGIESKFNALTELKPQRTELSRQIGVTKQLKQEALNQLSDDAVKTYTKLRGMKSKYNEFISRLRVQQEKELGNKLAHIPRIIKTLGRIGRGGITALSIIPSVLDAVKYSQDPEAYLFSIESGGEQLAPKGSEQREIQTGRLL